MKPQKGSKTWETGKNLGKKTKARIQQERIRAIEKEKYLKQKKENKKC